MSDGQNPPRPGRPRSERARIAILDAAADLLIEGGLAEATMEAIAARAHVSKVTIYKWWPSRGAVAIDAYFHRYEQTLAFGDSGDIAADLVRQIRLLIDAFSGRAGTVMAEIIGQAQSDPILATTLRDKWLQPRREVTTALLQQCVDRGEIRSDVDTEALMDQIYAPLYFRLIMGHQPLRGDLAEILVRNVLDGVRPLSRAEQQRSPTIGQPDAPVRRPNRDRPAGGRLHT